MAKNPEIQSLLMSAYSRLESSETFSIQDVVEDEEINAIWLESLRFLGPTVISYRTNITKACTLGKYKLKKGDTALFYVASSATVRESGDLARFDHTRFLDK